MVIVLDLLYNQMKIKVHNCIKEVQAEINNIGNSLV